MYSKGKEETPDFVELRKRYDGLPSGQRAELRRVAEPFDLSFTGSFYRLFPGERIGDRHRRIAFMLPWCSQTKGRPAELGKQFVDRQIAEARVLQVARASWPVDLIQLRRLAIHVEPVVDWACFGLMLWFWGPFNKRRFVEDFYLALFKHNQGGKK